MASSLRLMLRPSVLPRQTRLTPFPSRRFSTGNLLSQSRIDHFPAQPLLFRQTPIASILPAGPRTCPVTPNFLCIVSNAATEVIQGTVNDPVPIHPPSKAHGSYHWTFERVLSVALIPLVVTPFVTGSSSPILDALLGSTIVIHSHIGFDAMITDYIPTRTYPKTNTFFMWGLRLATGVVLIGIYEFQVNEVGMSTNLFTWEFVLTVLRTCGRNQEGLDCVSTSMSVIC